MNSAPTFWSVLVVCSLATQITRFAPFLMMHFFANNEFLLKFGKRLAPAILALLIFYCFKDYFTYGLVIPYSILLPVLILIYLQVRTRNALLSIGLATVAYAFLLKI